MSISFDVRSPTSLAGLTALAAVAGASTGVYPMAIPTSTGRRVRGRWRSLASSALILAISASPVAHAEVFGACAHAPHPDAKIGACTAAAKSTGYPWILRWVYRELGDAYRERGELGKAVASYQRSLATERIPCQAEDEPTLVNSSR